MVTLLDEYMAVLKEVEIRPESSQGKATENYYMPSDFVSSDEWAEFENVYQIHCPSIFMDSAVRDVSVLLTRFIRCSSWYRSQCNITTALVTDEASNII